MRRAAAVDALFVMAALIVCVMCPFAYDVAFGLGELIAIFFLGSCPLLAVVTLDGASWRRVTGVSPHSPLVGGARDATTMAAVGLPLLLIGAFFSVIEVGFGGVKGSAYALWTSTAVGYLLLTAFAAQLVLVLLTSLLRRSAPAGVRRAS